MTTSVPNSTRPSRRAFLRSATALAATTTVAGWQTSVARADTAITNDGVRLNYIEQGKGRPLVLVPGWSQTAAMYKHQIEALSRRYRVIAVDMRGHGDSDKPAHGYRIARLADDLHDFIAGMNLRDVVLGGHSMGCSVIWSYWDQYGADRISKLLLIDQAPATTFWPGWTDDQKQEAGAIFDPKTLVDTAAAIGGADGVKTTEGFVNGFFFTKEYSPSELAWVLSENLKFPRASAAKLLVDHCMQDWRDTIPRIDVPTLVVGGEASFFTPRSQQWIASQIPGGQAVIFGANEGGSHFMFMENPGKFNAIAEAFIG